MILALVRSLTRELVRFAHLSLSQTSARLLDAAVIQRVGSGVPQDGQTTGV